MNELVATSGPIVIRVWTVGVTHLSNVRSFPAYTRTSIGMPDRASLSTKSRTPVRRSVEPPCCLLLSATEVADETAAVGVALLTQRPEDIPRRNAFSVLVNELPAPASFGEYDIYEAVLFEPNVISFVATLTQTPTHVWAGSLSGISQPFSATMRLIVRPASTQSGATGPALLEGDVSECMG